jgi:hypothetical protein
MERTVSHVLQLLSAASLGVFVGAMLTEGFVLVPDWRSLAPRDFLAWYARNDRRLFGYFGPLTIVTALTALAAAIASFWEGHPGRWPTLVATVNLFVVVLMFPLYFEGVNASFAAATIAPDDVPGALTRWAAWHRLRTALSMVALAAALLALGRGG